MSRKKAKKQKHQSSLLISPFLSYLDFNAVDS